MAKKSLQPPPRPVRFTPEEDAELQEAAQKLHVSISEVIRLCVRCVQPANLPADFHRPEDSMREHVVRLATQQRRPKVQVRLTPTGTANGNSKSHERRQP